MPAGRRLWFSVPTVTDTPRQHPLLISSERERERVTGRFQPHLLASFPPRAAVTPSTSTTTTPPRRRQRHRQKSEGEAPRSLLRCLTPPSIRRHHGQPLDAGSQRSAAAHSRVPRRTVLKAIRTNRTALPAESRAAVIDAKKNGRGARRQPVGNFLLASPSGDFEDVRGTCTRARKDGARRTPTRAAFVSSCLRQRGGLRVRVVRGSVRRLCSW